MGDSVHKALYHHVGLFLLCFAFMVCGAYAEPTSTGSDTVIFKNGDRISGQLLRADSQIVQLKSRALGELKIHWSDIQEVRSRNRRWRIEEQRWGKHPDVGFQNAVLRNNDSVVAMEADSHMVLVPSGDFVLFTDQDHPAAGETQIIGVKNPSPPPNTSFAISVNAPESVVIGSQSQLVFGGNFRVLHNEADLCAAPEWFSSLLAEANHNRTYKVDTAAIVTDTYDGTLSLANRLSSGSKIAGYVVADLFGNSSLGIGLQQSYGFGVYGALYSNSCHGTTAFLPQHHKLAVNGDVSLRYIHQRLYAPGISQDLAGLRLHEDLVYVSLKDGTQNERFTIQQSMWVIPMLNRAQSIEAGGELGISVPLGRSLSVGLSEEEDFFNDAPKAKRKNYLKSALSATYTFPALSPK